ncbi:MAG: cache domain-containing protein [Thermodesulfovibrionales bacterium]
MKLLKWNKLKIRTQAALAAIAIILLSTLVLVTITVMAIQKKSEADILQYKNEEIAKKKKDVKSLVDIAYATIDTNYRNARSKEFLEKYYGHRLRNVIDIAESVLKEKAALAREGKISVEEAKRQAKEDLKRIRYDNGTGYVWINNLDLPATKIIMHPIDSTLEGTVNWKEKRWHCAEGKNRYLFEAFIDICRKKGAGFVDYVWDKPSGKEIVHNVPKLSYVRLFKDWGWIIGTGIYVDDAMQDSIDRIMADIGKMRYDDGSGYFWINDTGTPFPKMVMHATIPSLDGHVLDDPGFNCASGENRNLFQALVEVCSANGEGYVDYYWPRPTETGLTVVKPKLAYVKLYKPLGWIIGTGVYTDGIDEAIAKKTASMKSQINALITKIALFSAFVMFAGVVLSAISLKTITSPIRKLIGAMKKVEREGLSSGRVSLGGAAEIEELGGIFNGMMEAISAAVRKLTEATAAKERIEGELSAAREIQMSMLPKIFPAFPHRTEFDIHAIIEPAKEVGGDFYDFFFIDDHHFCFVIGDVSGKGVPASLFMVITKTLHKASAAPDVNPGLMLTRVNSELSQNNDNSMFVTMFCGILNTTTGEVCYANGGHNPPLLISGHSGEVSYLSPEPGLMVGAFEGITYKSGRFLLVPGDIIFLYTDGVTEAMNVEESFFSSERLKDVLSSMKKDNSVRVIVSDVMGEVISFAGGAPQSDDITIMSLEFRGNGTRTN